MKKKGKNEKNEKNGKNGKDGTKTAAAVTTGIHLEEEDHLVAPKSCRCFFFQPLVLMLMLTRLCASTILWCTTTNFPIFLPFVGGKCLTKISFLARTITTRVHMLCWLPIEIVAVSRDRQNGIIYPNSVRARHHIAVWSTVW